MLITEEIRIKLYQQAYLFPKLYMDHDYYRAKAAYDTSVAISTFCGFDQNDMKELFGKRGEKGVGSIQTDARKGRNAV